MKSIMVFIVVCVFSMNVFAQDEQIEKSSSGSGKSEGFFKKENLFTGGNLNLAFGNNITVLGISPYLGYSINKYLDVAVAPTISYTSQRDIVYLDDKLRQTVYGPGAFVRVFPFKFVFAQAQYQFNLIRQKYILPRNTGLPNERYKFDAHSLLVGAGYAQGRDEDNNSFFYISVMWDVAKSKYSPYKDNLNRAIPIIWAGYNIALFQGRR